MIVIGIDPGVTTGIAICDALTRKLVSLNSTSITQAMPQVCGVAKLTPSDALVLVEDARKRFVFDAADERMKYGAGIREGVGSVKRDCGIWEEYLKLNLIPYVMKAPRRTKLDASEFNKQTGWQKPSNQHMRDAAMIVHGLNEPMARGLLQSYQQATVPLSLHRRGSNPLPFVRKPKPPKNPPEGGRS